MEKCKLERTSRQKQSTSLSINFQTASLPHPMRFRRRIPTNRNHIPHSPIIPPQTARVGTSTPLIRHLSLDTDLLRNDNSAIRLLLLATDRQNPLVAGPRGVVSDRERVLRAPRVFLVFDPHVALQRVALRARFAASAEQGAEADGFGELAE
jgi:hypothetical protein